MFKKLLLTLGIAIIFSGFVYSQSGTLKGKVTDQTGQALQYTNVYLKKEDKVINYALTSDKGEYQIFGIATGTYDVEVDATTQMSCKKKQTTQGVQISDGKTMFLDITINCATDLQTVVIVYQQKVFDKDKTVTSVKLSGDDVRKTPGHSISNALANMEGVTAIDGAVTSVRGNRPDGQQMIIDGVKVRGNSGVAMSSIEEMELIQGGIPAEYGDGTSFTIITTKGASREYHGSVELMGSLDGYNNFLGAFNLTGPILKGVSRDDPARIGFLISGEVTYDKDGYPAQGGTWRATQETIDYLIQNPNRYIEGGGGFPGIYKNVDFVTKDDLKLQRVRDNAENWGYLLQGKLDFVAGKKNNILFSLGGSYEYNRGKNWSLASALFNAQNNGESMSSTLRLNARLNHRVFTDTAANSILQNVMYNVNVNYTYYNGWSRDARHRENYFDYGHIGKFTTTKAKSYEVRNITIDSIDYYNMYVMANIGYDSLVTFDGTNSSNPDLAYYTQNFIDDYTPTDVLDAIGYNYNKTVYQMYGALLNGDVPSSSYGLFSMPGTVYNGFSKSQFAQLGAKASLTMNLKDHELKLGYEFEKLTSRAFGLSPVALWTLMRQNANSHINELDLDNPIFVGYDTIRYERLVNLDAQSTFDRNLRSSLGMDPSGDEWIDIDSYDPSTFDLGMFSAEELLVGTGGGALINYYGYDYTGANKYSKKTSIKDFFTATDANGNKTYSIGAYEPIYMSLWLQDKFSINNLLFNIGVRIDRFDANQSVLKDPYLFRDAYTAGEVKNEFVSNNETLIPDNVGDDWVVYVNQKDAVLDAANSNIVGFRNGSTWYDANGQEISDPESILGANGGPILKTAIEQGEGQALTKVHYEAFEDYKPQWSVMPRLSFSFPVSDNSLFAASYSIITNRPTNLQLNPIDYLFIEKFGSQAGNIVTNPNLKPSKSIEYEISFRQKVGDNSAIALLAYYSEKRDQIQAFRYSGAYPSTYYSYANLDFGTVQGFTLSYELKRFKNVAFRASYTLQFAKGTGSSATSGLAIIASGQPNLRTLTDLSFDQRHSVGLWLDYRFDQGLAYDGPVTKRVKKGTNEVSEIKWLENMGISLNLSARSGTPYSRSSKAFSEFISGTNSQLSGSINGSSKPWIFQADIRIDKTFAFNLYGKNAKDKEGNPKGIKQGFLTVYLDLLNVLNLKNIIYVYEYTGNPDDDGYLTAAEYQQQILSQVSTDSYYDLYTIRMKDPYNYTQPIRARLGLQFSF